MDKNKRYIGQFEQLPLTEAREQLMFLRRYGVVYFWLHVFSATMLCALLWWKIDAPALLTVIWYAVVVLLAAGCWVTKSRFAKSLRMSHDQLLSAMQHYRFVNMMLCTVWGVSGIILFCDVAIGQAVHVCILMVLSLSVWPMLLISKAEFYLQLILFLLPITLMLALQYDLETNLLCIVILAFAGVTLLVTQLFSQIMNHLFSIQQSLVEQVHTDPVTQLINRSHFDQTFKTEWQRSAREGHSLSLVLIEIDDFQQIELQGGNSISEQYLRVITHCLKLIARRGSDTLARYGRAEFIALLPGTPLEEAVGMAERLRQEVEQAQLIPPLETEVSVSVTIGVSSCTPTVNPVYGEHVEGEGTVLYPAVLLSTADRALQRAKNKGHNRVEYQACGEEDPALATVYQS